jgi:hypothetical protein
MKFSLSTKRNALLIVQKKLNKIKKTTIVNKVFERIQTYIALTLKD